MPRPIPLSREQIQRLKERNPPAAASNIPAEVLARRNPGAILKRAKRVAGGIKARAHGNRFEDDILKACEVPGSTFEIVRIPSGCKWVMTARGPIAKPAKSPFDFCGEFTLPENAAYSAGIFFDAKHTEKERPSFYLSSVPDHQIKHLRRLAAIGACAGLLVECHQRRDFRWLYGTDFGNLKPVRWDDPRWVILLGFEHGIRLSLLKLADYHALKIPGQLQTG